MKIEIKLTAGFLLVALLVGIISYISVAASQSALEKSIGTSATLLSREILDTIDRTIHNKIDEFKLYTQNDFVKDAVIASNNEFELLQERQSYIMEEDQKWKLTIADQITPFMQDIIGNELSGELRKRMQFHKDAYGFDVFGEIFITNKYGANIAQTGKTSDYYQGDEEWWQTAQAEGIFIKDVEYDESAQLHSVDIAIRINGYNNEFIGVIKIVLGLKEIIAILDESQAIPGTAFTTRDFELLTEDGRVIYATAGHDTFEDISETDYFGNFHDSKGYFISNYESDEPFLIAYSHSKGYKNFEGFNWILGIRHLEKEILTPVNVLKDTLVIASFIIVVLAIVIGLFFSASISRPIRTLTQVIEDISIGKLDSQIDPNLKNKNDEIAKLARAFDRTIVSLKLAMKKSELHEKEEKKEEEEKRKPVSAQNFLEKGLIKTNNKDKEVKK